VDPAKLRVDLILISHGHYDHLDLPSLKAIDAPVVAPKGLGRYMRHKEVRELGWWDEMEVSGVRVRALPAKHWHQRTPFDRNRAHWCGFLVDDLFFCGDSAYDEHFERIGQSFDVGTALLPIGAYLPRHIMRHNHLGPDEAYRAFLDLKARCFIPYHYGTFILSDEPVDDPLRRIEALAAKDARIKILSPGEWRDLL
jgi:L-ascorbate metabolism protein UlaG (beta-lactamase superfamily)